MSDIHRFEATYVSCFSENDVDIIGIGDDDQNPHHFIILMQQHEEGISPEQSTELQTEDTNQAVTDAVQAIHMTRQSFRLTLSSALQAQLGYGVIEAMLPERCERQLLSEYLHLCFDKTSITLSINND